MRVTVNGKVYEVPDGQTVAVLNGEVLVGGLVATTHEGSVIVNVEGDCGNIQTVSGDVRVYGNARGNVETVSGDVTAEKIYGKASTVSGDINTHGAGPGD